MRELASRNLGSSFALDAQGVPRLPGINASDSLGGTSDAGARDQAGGGVSEAAAAPATGSLAVAARSLRISSASPVMRSCEI